MSGPVDPIAVLDSQIAADAESEAASLIEAGKKAA